MCGIAGQFHTDGRPIAADIIVRMTDALHHRGPDDEGVWVAGAAGLGSRRLAVIDVSARGHQPMTTGDGRFAIAFNGEVYNHHDLRRQLEAEGVEFRSKTDTEAVLQLYARRGAAALQELRGMFAFAVWDAERREMFVARDRLGKKPLYYAWDGISLTFASEAKALLRGGVSAAPDPLALDEYLTWGYVPAPRSAFKAVQKLPPAHFLVVGSAGLRIERYWRLHYAPKRAESEDALAEELLALLRESVAMRMVSDVPVGALLSGGIDSSAVLALMRDVHAGPLRAFSIGFEDPAYDELAYARDVARHVDAEHHALVVRPDPHRIVATVPVHYSEPFADSSALPALEVSRLARTEVTVALSGDGGDESFIGYDRYRASRWAVRADALPPRLRRALAQAAAHLPAARTKGAFARLRRFGESLALPVDRRYARWLTCVGGEQKQALYAPGLQSAVDGFDASALLDGPLAETDAPDPVEALVAADMQTYLPDDLLVKMDIASMAHSLEVRSPLLDHRVVEFAASLPVALKLRGREHKYLLKRAMRGYLPDRILTRRKMGFGVPIDAWLRGELREMVRETLLSRRALERGYFNAAPLRRLVDDHQAGRANHHFTLWALLMLELWHREYVDAPETRRHPLVTVVPAS